MNEQQVEEYIQEHGLTAPRITPEHINRIIVDEDYHVFGDVLTVCCLTLENGFTVTGESACASPENFDADLGRQIARDNARDKIWALEGYLLRQMQHITGGWGRSVPEPQDRPDQVLCRSLLEKYAGAGFVSGIPATIRTDGNGGVIAEIAGTKLVVTDDGFEFPMDDAERAFRASVAGDQ